MDGTLLIAIAMVVVVLVLVLVNQGIRVVKPHQRVVVFRMGKADESGVRGPGLAFIIPVIDRGVTVDVREQKIAVSSQAVTKDNATVGLGLELSWQIIDPLKSVVNVANFPAAIEGVTMTKLRSVIGDLSLDEVLSRRNRVIDQIRDDLDSTVTRWGGHLLRVELGEITRYPDVPSTDLATR